MKSLKYIQLLFIGLMFFISCEEDTFIKDIENSPNIAGFENNRLSITEIADGEEYPYAVKVKVQGPTSDELSGDITVSISANAEASTAVEGTHFRIDDETITLTKENNYLGLVNITMLTEGIETPLDKSPVLVLETTQASGESNVIASGKPINVTLNYACPSELEGTYDVTTVRDDGATVVWTETINNTGVGQYLTNRFGLWDPPLNPTYGFPFSDVCGVITVSAHNLADTYSNQVYSHQPGMVDPETGVITIYYTIEFTAGNSTYTATYTPVSK